MYPVSDAYKSAAKARVLHSHLSGTVGGKAFTEENVIAGSFTVSGQCCSDTDVEIGTAYVGELTATFRGISIARSAWTGAQVVPYYALGLPGGTQESVPMGVYTISEAAWVEGGVQVRAYDNISKLDKAVGTLDLNGYPYDIAARAFAKCGVQGAQTRAEIEALPNGACFFSCFPTNDIETCRDLLFWVAQTLGCFVVADRHGKIAFRPYNWTIVDTIDASHRWEASFSDYQTRYTGMSVVDMQEAKTKYIAATPDDGLTYNLGSNPYLQRYGANVFTVEQMRVDVFLAIRRIYYVPFSSVSIGTPAYDLGDVVTFTGGIADGRMSCITKYSYTYHGGYKMEGVGRDPSLASGKSKSDKNLIGLISEQEYLERLVRSTERHYYDYVSLTSVSVPDDGSLAEVADIDYTCGPLARIEFRGELQLDVSPAVAGAVGEVVATYLDNGVEVASYHPTEELPDGKRLMHLLYLWNAPPAGIEAANFKLFLSASGAAVTVGAAHCYVTTTGETSELSGVIYIYMASLPTKQNYYVGDALDYTGAAVVKVYKDGTQVDVTASCTFDPADGTVTTGDGTTTVYVSYTDPDWGVFETQFDLEVLEVELVSIAVATPPSTTSYTQGDQLDLSGLSILGTYNNGTTADVTSECDYDPAGGDTLDTPGTIAVGVTCDGCETSFDVSVAAVLASIEVTRQPTKTSYTVGDHLDYSGIEVTATYTDGEAADVTSSCTYSPAAGTTASEAGFLTVTASYTEDSITETADFTLAVDTPVTLESIAIATPPTKTAYYAGEPLDYTGMAVMASYNSGAVRDVTSSCSFSPAAGTAVAMGMAAVTASYSEGGVTKTDSVAITVGSRRLTSIAVTAPPAKTAYTLGESIDYAGCVVTATYSDGSTADVTASCSFSPASGTATTESGFVTVNVEYEEGGATETAMMTLEVNPAPMTYTLTTASSEAEYGELVTTDGGAFALKHAFEYEGEAGTIDEGELTVLAVDDDFETIVSIDVEGEL